MESPDELNVLIKTLITANHILHYHNVVDAYGHISFRHPKDPTIFIMSNSVAPAVVSSPSDLIEYNVSDCSPVDPNAKKGYQERFIHGEIYKKFKGINSIVHSHAEEVLPYTMNGVPLRPAFHLPGFLGTSVPNYDITKLYKSGDTQNMLVNREHLGSNLASHFLTTSANFASSQQASPSPNQTVVLMKNHGFTAVGANIPQAVFRAVYTQVNARVQSKAIMLRNAFLGNVALRVGEGEGEGQGMSYLSEDQVVGCGEMADGTQERPWGLWVREVEACPLYVNNA